jgi:hypothetical protein
MTASQKLPPAPRRGVRSTSKAAPVARTTSSPAATRPRSVRKTPSAATPLAGLQAELGGLRTALDEILARVRSRMVARLEKLEGAASGEPALAASLVEDMRDDIKRAGINPRKGRMKDLARLKGLLDVLCGGLPGGGK